MTEAPSKLFSYTARHVETGVLEQGEQAGASAYAVRSQLRRIGLQVEHIEALGDRSAQLPRWLQPWQQAWYARLRRQRQAARADLFDALATMIEAGMPLETAMQRVSQSQARSEAERRMLRFVREQLRAGLAMHEACAEHPQWYDRLDRAMLQAGQAMGDLPRVMRSLAEFHQASGALSHKLIAALAYPVFLLLMALAVVLFLSQQTLPQLATMLQDANLAVPALTSAVMIFGSLLWSWWWFIAFGIIVAALLLQRFMRQCRPDTAIGRLLHHNVIALAGRRAQFAQLAQVLARLQRSGMPLTESIEAAAAVMKSTWLRQLLQQSISAIREGTDFSASLAQDPLIDEEFVQLLELGEQSGEMASVLDRLSERYQRAAEQSMDRMTALLEPLAIVVLATLVGLVVFAALLPLIRMGEMF